MNITALDTEIEELVNDFTTDLRSRGEIQEADNIRAGDYSGQITQAELIPKLSLLQDEFEIKLAVIAQLEKKQSVAMATGAVADHAKVSKALNEVKLGDYSHPMAKAARKTAETSITKAKKAKQQKQSEMSLQEIIDRYNFHMSSTGVLLWYYQSELTDEFGNRNWYSMKKETLQANFAATTVYIRGQGGEPDYSSYNEFNVLLRDQNRYFTDIIQSYIDQEGTLNIMNRNFCEPAADGSTDYHWIFDAIYESVSGGDEGSPEHESFQKTVFSKYNNPNNPFLPNLFVKNTEGRCAKDLFAETHIMRLFNGNVATNCNIDHLLGKFNAYVAGKAVIVVNETVREKVDVEKIKQHLGSKRFTVEEKFAMPYQADNTALVISFTNALAGGVSLGGTKSDERYSLFSTDKVFRELLQKYFKEKEGVELTALECKKWLESNDPDSGQNILRSKEQNGKWINAMKAKYGNVTYVEQHHGEVYKDLLDEQRGSWLDTVEQVFTEPGFIYIRDDLLRSLIKQHHSNDRFVPQKKSPFAKEVNRLCADRNISVVRHKTAIVDLKTSIQRPCWKIDNGSGTVKKDETMFGKFDDSGRWIWHWVG